MENAISIQEFDPKRLDGLTPQQIVEEIKQITAQYDREVPGKRRHWPESIKARVLALGRLGIAPSKIADLTEISRATVFLWCRSLPRRGRRTSQARAQKAQFIELSACNGSTVGPPPVSPTVRPCPSIPVQPLDDRVTLITPDGFRLEFSGGAGLQAACAAYLKLRADP